MSDIMACDNCGRTVWYDEQSTLYLKCPYCDNVLIDRDVNKSHLEPMTVVDYGKDGEWMWVECEDHAGNKRTYWKQMREHNVSCEIV